MGKKKYGLPIAMLLVGAILVQSTGIAYATEDGEVIPLQDEGNLDASEKMGRTEIRILELGSEKSYQLKLTEDDFAQTSEQALVTIGEQVYLNQSGVDKMEHLKKLLLAAGIEEEMMSYAWLYESAQPLITAETYEEWNVKEDNMSLNYDMVYLNEKSNMDEICNMQNLRQNALLELNAMARSYGVVIAADNLLLEDGWNMENVSGTAPGVLYQNLHQLSEEGLIYQEADVLDKTVDITQKIHPQFILTDASDQDSVEADFMIQDELGVIPASGYTASLYLDLDQDGRLEEAERMNGAVITNAADQSLVADENGNCVLQSGNLYHIALPIPEETKGYITYRLVVTAADNPNVNLWIQQHVTMDMNDSEHHVNILQIRDEEDTLDLQHNSLFLMLKDGLSDYQLNVKSITVAQYEEQFEAGAVIGKNLLDTYDVVLLNGTGITDEVSADNSLNISPDAAIAQYAESGHGLIVADGDTQLQNEDIKVQVQNINNGFMNNYPYEIPDSFVVNSGIYPTIQTPAGIDDKMVWYSSASDTAVFLSSCNNIIYSSMGGMDFTLDENLQQEAVSDPNRYCEMKLLINTLIAGYHAGIKKPEIVILNGTTTDTGKKNVEYLLADELADESTESSKNMEFCYSLEECNVSENAKNISVTYYAASPEGTEVIADGIKASKLGDDGHLDTYVVNNGTASGAETGQSLTAGRVYQVSVPESAYTYMESQPTMDIYVVATSTVVKDGKEVQVSGYSKLTIAKVQLFDLA